ncbi:MAG: pentapeptide repeat-containing protein [Cyanobacteria bacterium P01_G01_bin.39]
MNEDLSLQKLEAQVKQILDAETNDFFELAKIAGIDPLKDLKGADLRNSNLRKADLREADLSYANLAGACLEKADLSRVNLQGANLSNANLSNAIVHKADFKDAKVYNLNLAGVDYSQACNLILEKPQYQLNKATRFYEENLAQTFQDVVRAYRVIIDSPAGYILEKPQSHLSEFFYVGIYGEKKRDTVS